MTDYYKKLLRTNETVLHRGKLHWRVYLRAFGLLLVGATLIGTGGAFQGPPLTIIGFALLLLAATAALDAWWRRLTTEIIVTDMRVIWKRNWVAVKTREINLSKIETVDIRQSIFDRLIGSGTVVMSAHAVRGSPFFGLFRRRAASLAGRRRAPDPSKGAAGPAEISSSTSKKRPRRQRGSRR